MREPGIQCVKCFIVWDISMESDVETDLKTMWYHIDMKESKCFFCDKAAVYFDIVMKDSEYIVADVCSKHVVMGLSS